MQARLHSLAMDDIVIFIIEKILEKLKAKELKIDIIEI
jgi:hypothetical protein